MTDEEKAWLRSEFERCAPWIQAALDRDIGTHEIPDVWDVIAAGGAQLWPLRDSAVVTALEFYPRKTRLRYWLTGGDLNEILAAQPMIEKWARSAGATEIFAVGRKGWLRKLVGFKPVPNIIVMTKAL